EPRGVGRKPRLVAIQHAVIVLRERGPRTVGLMSWSRFLGHFACDRRTFDGRGGRPGLGVVPSAGVIRVRHRGNADLCHGDVLGLCQPSFLAARTSDGTAFRAETGGIDRIGCRTMGTNDVHGRIAGMTLPGPYAPTVNESETITDAQPVGEAGGCQETRGFR